MGGHARRPWRRSFRQDARLAALRVIARLYDANPAGEASTPRSVLLIRPDHLGDLLFLTPALRRLREALPSARLTLLAGPWGAEAVRGNPALNEIKICRFPGFERRPKGNALAPYQLLAEQAREIRAGGYEAAVVLRFDHWWGAWLAAAAGIPRRIGYAWPETKPFLTEALPYLPERHEVEQNAALLDTLAASAPPIGPDGMGLSGSEFAFGRPGPLRYHVAEEDRTWAEGWLAAHDQSRIGGAAPGPTGAVAGLPARSPVRAEGKARPAPADNSAGRPLVAIHVGAGAEVKQWPPAAWAAVATGLQSAANARVLLTGGPGERELAEAITGSMAKPPSNAAGETATVGQLAALLARCDLVLGSDSGPLHLAVAVGAPTLHLYGPVAVDKFGPWGDPARQRALAAAWACVPCNRLDWPAADLRFHGCMRAIPVDRVLDEALDILAAMGWGSGDGTAHPPAPGSRLP